MHEVHDTLRTGTGYRADSTTPGLDTDSPSSLTHTETKAVEGVPVDAIQFANEGDGKLHHVSNLGLLPVSVLKPHRDEEYNLLYQQVIALQHLANWVVSHIQVI